MITAEEAREYVENKLTFEGAIKDIEHYIKEAISKCKLEMDCKIPYLKNQVLQEQVVNHLKNNGYKVIIARVIDDFFCLHISWDRTNWSFI